MTIRRLLPVLLVLLHAGLTAAHAHAHSGPARCSPAPHLHACELLELVTAAHHEQHDGEDGDGDEHDADAVDLSDLMASTAPPALETGASDLAPVDAGAVFVAASGLSSFPLGLPPSTAGPRPPLYITFRSLTI